jgi:hypothetical protein
MVNCRLACGWEGAAAAVGWGGDVRVMGPRRARVVERVLRVVAWRGGGRWALEVGCMYRRVEMEARAVDGKLVALAKSCMNSALSAPMNAHVASPCHDGIPATECSGIAVSPLPAVPGLACPQKLDGFPVPAPSVHARNTSLPAPATSKNKWIQRQPASRAPASLTQIHIACAVAFRFDSSSLSSPSIH